MTCEFANIWSRRKLVKLVGITSLEVAFEAQNAFQFFRL